MLLDEVPSRIDLDTQLRHLAPALLNLPDTLPNSTVSNKHYIFHCIFIFTSILYVQASSQGEYIKKEFGLFWLAIV